MALGSLGYGTEEEIKNTTFTIRWGGRKEKLGNKMTKKPDPNRPKPSGQPTTGGC